MPCRWRADESANADDRHLHRALRRAASAFHVPATAFGLGVGHALHGDDAEAEHAESYPLVGRELLTEDQDGEKRSPQDFALVRDLTHGRVDVGVATESRVFCTPCIAALAQQLQPFT